MIKVPPSLRNCCLLESTMISMMYLDRGERGEGRGKRGEGRGEREGTDEKKEECNK